MRALSITVGKDSAPSSCQESFVAASLNGRHWIVMRATFRTGASFDGSTQAVELRGGVATPYVDDDGLVYSCDSAAHAPKGAPADWFALPTDLTRFLCGFAP